MLLVKLPTYHYKAYPQRVIVAPWKKEKAKRRQFYSYMSPYFGTKFES
jgi:hypothetical protein